MIGNPPSPTATTYGTQATRPAPVADMQEGARRVIRQIFCHVRRDAQR